MHQRETDGIGRRPGLYAKPPPIEEVRASIIRKVEAIERAREIPEVEKAAIRDSFALRRGSRPG